jgi:3-hydroxyisobutyrate dehydrogenase
MARNIRAKIPASDTLVIHDVNEDVMHKFANEAKAAGSSIGAVEIADNARTVAEKAVSYWFIFFAFSKVVMM